jgi:hypothetical protein
VHQLLTQVAVVVVFQFQAVELLAQAVQAVVVTEQSKQPQLQEQQIQAAAVVEQAEMQVQLITQQVQADQVL